MGQKLVYKAFLWKSVLREKVNCRQQQTVLALAKRPFYLRFSKSQYLIRETATRRAHRKFTSPIQQELSSSEVISPQACCSQSTELLRIQNGHMPSSTRASTPKTNTVDSGYVLP
jgi:hypothetical protein